MTDLKKLYQDYGEFNILYNQLGLPSPSVDYAWRRTKKIIQDEVLNIIQNSSKILKICDIGCGNGALIIRLAEYCKNTGLQATFVGYDLSSPFIEYAKSAAKYKELKNVTFKQFNIENEKLNDDFDIILSSEVLEHLHKPDEILLKIFNSLAKGGHFILTTPNSKNLIKYPFQFVKKFINKHDSEVLSKNLTKKEQTFVLAEIEQHLYVYSHGDLKKSLLKAGFEIVKSPRSTTLFGGPFLDNHPFLFGLTLLFDATIDLVNLPQLGWDNIFVSKKN